MTGAEDCMTGCLLGWRESLCRDLSLEFNNRDFWRREKTNRRAPRTRAPADMQQGRTAEVKGARIQREKDHREQREGKYLSFVRVARELQIEQPDS